MDGVDLVRRELGGARAGGARAVRCGGRARAAAAWALAAALACGGQRPFPGAADSLDELGRGALDAFERGDREALENFRLTESEHNGVVWPELPAARGRSPFPTELAWQNIELRNARAVPRAAEVLKRFPRREFESVECVGEVETFDTFRVHTDCHARFRSGGRRYRMQLFKDVLERGGGFKIFRYYDEDAEAVDESGGGG